MPANTLVCWYLGNLNISHSQLLVDKLSLTSDHSNKIPKDFQVYWIRLFSSTWKFIRIKMRIWQFKMFSKRSLISIPALLQWIVWFSHWKTSTYWFICLYFCLLSPALPPISCHLSSLWPIYVSIRAVAQEDSWNQ